MPLMLRQERQSRGWKQTYVARAINISKQMVNDMETGRRKPSYDVLVKLEDLFHKSHRQLFAVADEHQEQDTKKNK